MAFVLSDRIKETTTTTSTGTYTLGGAVSGFETFTANLSNSDTTYYCCTDGTDFEVGLGTFASSGTTLARTTIISSSNSNNAVNWSSGTRDIFCTLPGSKAIAKNGDGDITLADSEEIQLGNDADLRIFHNASHSIIKDGGTGNLELCGSTVKIRNAGRTEDLLVANPNGSVELYHNNSKKLETTSSGATVTGTLAATLSTAAQTNITSVGTLTGLTTSGTINLSQSSGTAIKTTGSLSSADLGVLRASASSGSDTHGFTIKYMGSRTGNNNSYSLFMDNQTGTDVEAMTVLQDGKVGINNTSPSAPLDVSGDAEITGTLTAGEVSATTLDIGGTNITATATEINKLDGVTATTTELNYVDVTTLGTVQASKAVTADANGDVLFPDNEKLKFGTGGDLQIYHSGSGSFISDGGTGNLRIGGSAVTIENASFNETMMLATQNGAVELYHDNVKKVETTSDGATVTGDLLISNSDADAVADPTITLYRNSSSPAFDDEMGEIIFQGRNNNSENINYGRIVGKIALTTDGSEKGNIEFNVMESGTEATFVQMAFDNIFAYKQLTMFNNIFLDGNYSIIWDGATNNSNTTSLVVTDPTAVNTITLPDATGTVLTTGNSDTPTTTTSSSDADFVLVDDGGTMKKITPSNLGITSGGASKGFAVAMAIAL